MNKNRKFAFSKPAIFLLIIIILTLSYIAYYFYYPPRTNYSSARVTKYNDSYASDKTKGEIFIKTLNNGYVLISSNKFNFSFEFPDTMQYIIREVGDEAYTIDFQTQTRHTNRNGDLPVFSYSTFSNARWEEVKSNPNSSQENINGLEANKVEVNNKIYLVIKNGDKLSELTYTKEFTSYNIKELSKEDRDSEEAAFKHILLTYTTFK